MIFNRSKSYLCKKQTICAKLISNEKNLILFNYRKNTVRAADTAGEAASAAGATEKWRRNHEFKVWGNHQPDVIGGKGTYDVWEEHMGDSGFSAIWHTVYGNV